jgi:hypothetical protein
MFTTTVFLDVEKAFDTTWHPGLLHELSDLHLSPSLIKLFSSLFSNRKFRVVVEGELPTSRDMQVGIPQVSVVIPTLYSLIYDTPQSQGSI